SLNLCRNRVVDKSMAISYRSLFKILVSSLIDPTCCQAHPTMPCKAPRTPDLCSHRRENLDVGNFAVGQTAKCFEIFCRRFLDNILRQLRGRWSFVPVKRLKIIAHELLVEARRALLDNVLVLWPKA